MLTSEDIADAVVLVEAYAEMHPALEEVAENTRQLANEIERLKGIIKAREGRKYLEAMGVTE